MSICMPLLGQRNHRKECTELAEISKMVQSEFFILLKVSFQLQEMKLFVQGYTAHVGNVETRTQDF